MHISKNEKTKGKRTILKIFLIFVCIVAVIIAVLAYWQRDNIKAFIMSRQYSQEEVAEKIAESKQHVQESLDKYDLPVVRDFTFEEEEKIRNGELSVEDAMQLIMVQDDGTSAEGTADAVTKDNTSDEKKDDAQPVSEGKTADAILSKYITRVYNLKAYYIGELGKLEGEMRVVYVERGKDKSKVAGIVADFLPQIGAMESECDRQIDSLLANLRSELSAIGADTSIADTIYDAYINEKALKKAYYISQYS